jgi:hypothetical protein
MAIVQPSPLFCCRICAAELAAVALETRHCKPACCAPDSTMVDPASSIGQQPQQPRDLFPQAAAPNLIRAQQKVCRSCLLCTGPPVMPLKYALPHHCARGFCCRRRRLHRPVAAPLLFCHP